MIPDIKLGKIFNLKKKKTWLKCLGLYICDKNKLY